MNSQKPLTIKELPEQDRPRERLLKHGAQTLSTADLVAILLRVGSREESAVRLAERLLFDHQGLAGLGRITPREMVKLKGIGLVKAVTIAAALELGKRLRDQKSEERPVIRNSQDVRDHMMPLLRYEQREKFYLLPLSTKNHVLDEREISIGSLNASIVHPRELFREALNYAAASVILVHNHPSGDPAPSREDIEVTRRLMEAGKLLEIPVLDHVIIGDGKYVSMKDKGII
ncbi:MAG: repair protein RadC [Anaerosporomusa subterranea]|jgi:DNA repair protein RadC|nr:repair protein RadC [Anaerosporomusa subterranea]